MEKTEIQVNRIDYPHEFSQLVVMFATINNTI